MTGARLAWARLGDPRLISWPTLVISLVIFLVDGAINAWSQGTLPIPAITGIVVAQLVCFGVLGLARLSRIVRGRPFSALIVILISSVIGVIAGGVIQSALAPLDFIPIDAAIYRTVVISIVGIAVVSWRTYRDSMGALLETRERLLVTQTDGAEMYRAEREAIVDDVTTMLESALADLDPKRAGTGDTLRSTARDIVRPLSHELATTAPEFAAAAPKEAIRVHGSAILREVLATPLMSPTFMAITVTVLATRLTVEEVPPEAGSAGAGPGVFVDVTSLALSLAFLGTLFVAVWLTTAFVRRLTAPRLAHLGSAQRIAVNVLGLLGIVLVTGFVIGVFRIDQGIDQVPFSVRGAVPILLVAAVLAIIRAVSARWSLSEQALGKANADLSWEVARTREALWQQRRALARAIHGPLQAAMTAGSMQLRDATDPAEAITRIQANIGHALGEIRGDSAALSLVEQFAAIGQTWSGVCTVHIEADDAVIQRTQADRVTATATVDIVGEAVANAALHGAASNAWVTLTCPRERVLSISVRDDGTVRSGEPTPGLGSAILDEVCVEWGLQQDELGSTLWAALPLAEEGRHDWHST